jgi:uncharacterized protein YjcR
MPKSLDKSGWEKVVREQIMRGEPVKAIAASLGCSNTSVVNFMRASGIAAPGKSGTPPRVELRARAAEATLRELAEVKRYGAEDIGPKLGVSPSTARTWLKRLGIDFPTNGRTVYKWDTTGWEKTVLPLYRKGVPCGLIADKMGCSVSTVHRWLANGGHAKKRKTHVW